MRKGKSVIGLKVISEADGTNLGNVKDLVFDHGSDQVLALLLSEKDLFGLIDAQIVPWEQIHSFGPDAVVVQSSASRIKAGEHARVNGIMNRNTALSGTRIYTTEGQDLGTLADMYFDENTGRIEGYEVSGGFVSDTISGKQYLPMPRELSLGKDVALVPPEVASELEAQKREEPGGLTASTNSLTEKVSGALETAKEKVSDTYANIAQASVEKQREFVIGKVASRDVIIPADKATPALTVGNTPAAVSTPVDVSEAQLTVPSPPTAQDLSSSGEVVDGEILVRKGETITAYHADRAISLELLGQLVIAATGGVASDAYTSGREKLSGAVSTGSTQASGVGADVQARAEQAAIGKPAGREVTAPDGSIIVAPGMIVTEDILSRARMFGKEKEVIASAGLGAASQGAQSLKETTVEGATNLWETIKHKAEDLANAAQHRKQEWDAEAEQAQINRALGRPVTRVILDQSDHIILNTGDLITHAALNRAREAGVLDVLLDSVYIVDPEITPEMMRAEEPGEAALSSQAEPSGGPITATVAPDQPAQDTPSQGLPPRM